MASSTCGHLPVALGALWRLDADRELMHDRRNPNPACSPAKLQGGKAGVDQTASLPTAALDRAWRTPAAQSFPGGLHRSCVALLVRPLNKRRRSSPRRRGNAASGPRPYRPSRQPRRLTDSLRSERGSPTCRQAKTLGFPSDSRGVRESTPLSHTGRSRSRLAVAGSGSRLAAPSRRAEPAAGRKPLNATRTTKACCLPSSSLAEGDQTSAPAPSQNLYRIETQRPLQLSYRRQVPSLMPDVGLETCGCRLSAPRRTAAPPFSSPGRHLLHKHPGADGRTLNCGRWTTVP